MRFLRAFVISHLIAAAFLCIEPSLAAAGSAIPKPRVSAPSAVLVDAATGAVLFEKDASRRLAPASITKIMTAAIALDHLNPEDIVTISRKAATTDGSSVYTVEGEQLSVRDLLYGLMLNSGNDAAVALAEKTSGSVDAFCQLMNQQVARIGASSTHFENPHGLDSKEHYTTAMDMAAITRYALNHPLFRQIVAEKTYEWEGQQWTSTLINHNKLLWQYDGCTGVKTGYTTGAKHTLVASAARNGHEVIAVLLGGENPDWLRSDAKALFDYGFSLEQTLVKEGDFLGQESLPFDKSTGLVSGASLKVLLPPDTLEDVACSVKTVPAITAQGFEEGQVVGRATYSLRGKTLGSVAVVSTNAVSYTRFETMSMVLRSSRRPLLLLLMPATALIAVAVEARQRKKRRLRRNRYWRRRGPRNDWSLPPSLYHTRDRRRRR